MILIPLQIDITKPYRQLISINQFDANEPVFLITLRNNGALIDLTGATVVFYAKKPDGNVLFNACDITDAAKGKCTYTVTSQTTAAAGTLTCQIVVTFASGAEKRSQEFSVTVKPSLDITGAIESTSEFTALQQALAQTTGFDARITQNTVLISSGWIPLSGTVTYYSVDDPIGVINVPSGHGITAGMRLKLTNGGNTIYGIVVASDETTITFLHEINPTTNQALHLLQNSAISDVYFSTSKAPKDFPLLPEKWSIKAIDGTSGTLSNPVSGTWYNLNNFGITLPIGTWRIYFRAHSQVFNIASPTTYLYLSVCLATSTGTISSDSELCVADFGGTGDQRSGPPMTGDGIVTLSEKTTYKLYSKYDSDVAADTMRANNVTTSFIRAICMYL